MPWLPIPDDHCRTAADVREANRRWLARKRKNKAWADSVAPTIKPAYAPPARPLSVDEKKVEEIIAFVCGYFGIPRQIITADGENLAPRHTVVYLTRTLLKCPWREIAAMVGVRDANVFGSFNSAKRVLELDPHHPVSLAVRAGERKFNPPPVQVVPPPVIAIPPEPVVKPHNPQDREFWCNDERKTPRSKMHAIVNAVAMYFGIEPQVLLSPRRTAFVVGARQIAMYLCCTCTNRSTLEIGDYLNRDHSTLLHGCRRVESELRDGDKEVIAAVQHLQDVIKGAPLVPRVPMSMQRNRYSSAFTADEKQTIREMWDAKASYAEIGTKLGRTEQSIEMKVRRMRLKFGHHGKYFTDWTGEESAVVREMYLAGTGPKAIAEKIGRTRYSVTRRVARMGLTKIRDEARKNAVPCIAVESCSPVLQP